MTNTLHETVFQFFESYREKHPDFVYWLRERNVNNRLNQGIWFQGTESYAFVGLYDGRGGSNMTVSIGLVFYFTHDKLCCHFENVFNEEKEAKILKFYSDMRNLVGGFKKDKDTKYTKTIFKNGEVEKAVDFLNNVKPQIDKLLIASGLSSMFIKPENFAKNLKRINQIRTHQPPVMPTTTIIANITWSSTNWTEPSTDKSNHRHVLAGGLAHESWNFDFNNVRNTSQSVFGYVQFTNPPRLSGNNNLVIFYSDDKIVGFYGKCEILQEPVSINENQNYNLIAARPFAIALKNHVPEVKKYYLEGKQRVGQGGFNYLSDLTNIKKIIEKSIELNPDQTSQLTNLLNWIAQEYTKENYWLFQASPNKGYRIFDALSDNVLNTWIVAQYKETIKTGDKIMLRIGGEKPGIYAFATVISNVSEFADDTIDARYNENPDFDTVKDRVRLRLDYNLINNPISKEIMDKFNLPGGTQGTNFKISKQQYFDTFNFYLKMNRKTEELNKILFGPPGTGKTYNTINEAVKIADEQFYEENKENRSKLQERFNQLLIRNWDDPKGQIAFCTFHQSFSYEDFVEGIKPLEPEKDDKSVKYKIVPGIFKQICQFADASNNARKIDADNLVSFSQSDFEKAIFYKVSLGNSTKEEDKEIYEYCIANNVIAIGLYLPPINWIKN